MDRLTIAVMSGLALGGTYTLVSIGLVLVFRATATLNFAQGQLIVLPALLVGAWQLDGRSFWLALLVAVAVNVAIGAAFYSVVLRRMVGLPLFMPIIACLGLAAILDGVIAMFHTAKQYQIAVPGMPSGITTLFGARLSVALIVAMLAAYLIATVVILLLRFTHTGTCLRAAGQDPQLAAQGGINVQRLYLLSWVASVVLAAAGGLVYGSTNVVSPSMVQIGLVAFPAMLLGGIDSLEGAVVGSISIGLLQGMINVYVGGDQATVLSYAVVLGVFLVRPSGLLGTRQISRV